MSIKKANADKNSTHSAAGRAPKQSVFSGVHHLKVVEARDDSIQCKSWDISSDYQLLVKSVDQNGKPIIGQ